MFQAQRPFGFGTSTPAFGGTAFGTTTTPGAFGATAGAAPAFGASATPAFGASTNPAFGTSTPAFGTATPAFGAPATTAFGAQPTGGGFGASMTPFGGAAGTTFGATATPAFGASTPSPAPSAFGAPTTPGGGFGAFGATQPTTTFGATQPTTTFGATPQPSAFGTPSTTGAFGSSTTTSSFAFGGTGFGAAAPAASPFASTPASTFSSPFASATSSATPATTTGSMFGGAAPTAFGGFGQTQPTAAAAAGTGNPKFQATTENDPNGAVNHQSITAMAAYNKKSFEELRWEDYQAGKKNSSSPAVAAAAGSFSTPGFGTAAPTTGSTAFGAFTPSITPASPFGTTATPTPSTTTPSTSAFGAFGTTPAATPATAAPFGSSASPFSTFTPSLTTPAPTTTTPAFGFPASTTTNPFGTTTTSPFGTTPSTSTFPSFATPATTTTATAPSLSAFGTTATNPFGSTAAAPTTSLFNPAPTTATTATNPFGTTTSFALPSTTPSLFNPAAPAATTSSLFPATSTATTQPSLFSGFAPATPTSFVSSSQIGLSTPPSFNTPITSISAPPVGTPLPTFSVPNGVAQASSTPVNPPAPLSFTPRTPTPQKNSYVSSYPRNLPSRSGSLVRIKDSPSYGGGRLFSDDKGFSPSNIHITPENISLRSGTPSRPRVDIKKLHLPPFEADKEPLKPKPIVETHAELNPPSISLTNPPSQLQTPTRSIPFPLQAAPSSRPRAESNDAPSLRNPNYFTKPSMDKLKEMKAEELSCIEDFVVGCVDLGSLRWHGVTDVRGLNLDDIVIFEKKAVTVYPDHGIFPKPPEGTGLNKPATITLLRVFPKKQDAAEKYTQMIANTTKRFKGKLLGYDPIKGIWEFEVPHFSRYGLTDDDEEQDNGDAPSITDLPVSQHTELSDFSVQSKISAPKPALSAVESKPASSTKPTSTHPSALQLSAYDSKSARNARLSSLSMRGVLFTDEPDTPQPITPQPIPVQPPSFRVKSPISVVPPFSQAFLAKEHERTERAKAPTTQQFSGQASLSIFTPLSQAEKEAELIVHAPQLRLKMLALGESVVSKPIVSQVQRDVGLTMGRSFRVGWGPDGKLLRTSGTLGVVTVSRPALSTVSVSASPVSIPRLSSTGHSVITPNNVDDNVASSPTPRIDPHILELLRTHLSHSTPEQGPHFVLQDLHANIQANISICNDSDNTEHNNYKHHLYLVWGLVYSLWGKMPEGSFLVEPGKPHGVDADNATDPSPLIRKLLVSKWLTQALQGAVEDSVKAAKHTGNNTLAILHYLTGRQVSSAVSHAQRSRDYRLAVLLAQTWTAPLQLVGAQIEQWEITKAAKYIESQLFAIYKMLAGDVEYVVDKIQELQHDWLRCFALHFWYKHVPAASMPSVLETYDAAVVAGKAATASPAYSKSGERVAARDSLYKLLQLYASTTHHQPDDLANSALSTTRFAPSTSSLPTSLLLSTLDPANQTQDPMDFSLAWHLYTVLRIVPALSSVVDLPVPHRLHTSYAAQLEISGQWQWAIYVLLHINFDSFKSANGEWKFASGRHSAISAILERHAAHISDEHYLFLTQQLQVPAVWVDAAIGRYLIYDRQYQLGVNHLLRAGEWNEAHRAILHHLLPAVIAPSNSPALISEGDVISLLETLQPNYATLADPSWNMGGNIYLAYLKLKLKLGAMPTAIEDNEVITKSRPQNTQLLGEMPNIYALCDLVAQWNQATAASHIPSTTRISIATIATYVGHVMLALAQAHRDPDLPHHIHALPLPPDVRAFIMDDYFHTMIYAV